MRCTEVQSWLSLFLHLRPAVRLSEGFFLFLCDVPYLGMLTFPTGDSHRGGAGPWEARRWLPEDPIPCWGGGPAPHGEGREACVLWASVQDGRRPFVRLSSYSCLGTWHTALLSCGCCFLGGREVTEWPTPWQGSFKTFIKLLLGCHPSR